MEHGTRDRLFRIHPKALASSTVFGTAVGLCVVVLSTVIQLTVSGKLLCVSEHVGLLTYTFYCDASQWKLLATIPLCVVLLKCAL